jgi:hypothetical protein
MTFVHREHDPRRRRGVTGEWTNEAQGISVAGRHSLDRLFARYVARAV